jgi:chromosome segregation ATPase
LHQEENKLAREEIKEQNLESTVEAVKIERDEALARLSEKEKRLDELDAESRRNQRAIDSKETSILLLQRKIDAIMERRAREGAGRAEVSPLEIKRDGLRAEITSTAVENSQLQQQWLQAQHEFVLLSQEMAAASEDVEELRTRNSVLLRKKLRLTREVETNEVELRRAKNTYSLMQNDIVKLNGLINKNAKVVTSLESGTELMEVDFLRMLKDEELESIRLQETIDDTSQLRTRMDQDLVESEREILLWEKRIQLAEEMKATLKGDDESGSELAAMKAEIHRMDLRSAQLARQKEVLIQEMEKSVERRGDIQVKAKASLNSKNNASVSKLKKQIVDLRKRVKQSHKDAEVAEDNMAIADEQIEELRLINESARRELQDTLDAVEDLKRDIAKQRRQRNVNLDEITRDQQLYRHLLNVQTKKKVFKKTSEAYDAAIQTQIDTLEKLNNVTGYIQQNLPEYGSLFDPIAEDITERLVQTK